MGLAGISADWKMAHVLWGAPIWIAQVLGILAMATFATLLVSYGIKAVSGFARVRAEFGHPVTGALFGLPLVSALLLPLVLADYSLMLARGVWLVAVIGMTVFAWTISARWLGGGQQRAHASPAWIVPLVGLLDIPLATPVLDFAQAPHAIVVWGLAVGLFFAVPLFTIILARLMFEEPMPQTMLPSLLILLAPFAVGFSAYVIVMGRVDTLAEGLLAITFFLLVALLSRLRHLASCCPFRVSWWSVSFPLAASAGAALRYATYVPSIWSNALAAIVLSMVSGTIAYLIIRTVVGMLRGEMQKLSG